MNITKRLARPRFALVIGTGLILAIMLTGGSLAAKQKESFVVYLNGGVAFPSEEGADDLKTGLFVGGGLAIGLGQGESISGELGLHLDYYHFPRKQPFGSITSENYKMMSLVGRLRFRPHRQFRPYALMGLGLFDIIGFGFTNTTFLLSSIVFASIGICR